MAKPIITGGGQNQDKKTGEQGQAFSYQIVASNSPTSYALASGTLQTGITLNTGTGLVSGVSLQAGIRTVTFTATNADGTSDPLQFIFYMSPAGTPQITSVLYDTTVAGDFYDYVGVATHSPTSWTGSGLPTGTTLNTTTGEVSGTTPAGAGGTTIFTLTAINGTGTGPATKITLVASPTGGGGGSVPNITSSPTATGTTGVPFTYTITADNPPITQYGATGLPPALSLDNLSGVISGTPPTAGVISIGMFAQNAVGTGPTTNLTLTISDPGGGGTPVVTGPLTGSGVVGSWTDFQIVATNSPTSYNLLVSGSEFHIPPDDVQVPDLTGRFRVRVFLAGTYHITLQATNGFGTGEAVLVLVVTDAGGGEPPPPPTPGNQIPGIYQEQNTFAEATVPACPVVVSGVPSDDQLPGTPLNLTVTTPGIPNSGEATGVWDPPLKT